MYEILPILCKNTWNATYTIDKKFRRNIMCTGHRKCAWNCALYCIRKFPGNYKFHAVRNVHTMNRKCDLLYTFLANPGISRFLPVSAVGNLEFSYSYLDSTLRFCQNFTSVTAFITYGQKHIHWNLALTSKMSMSVCKMCNAQNILPTISLFA